ncbi:hypothetical protein N9A58_06380 [Opitutales bacterium]|nr:hypothetical protein [Opitutales bacterium]
MSVSNSSKSKRAWGVLAQAWASSPAETNEPSEGRAEAGKLTLLWLKAEKLFVQPIVYRAERGALLKRYKDFPKYLTRSVFINLGKL